MTGRPPLHVRAPAEIRDGLTALLDPVFRFRFDEGVPGSDGPAQGEIGLILCEGLAQALARDLPQGVGIDAALARWQEGVEDCVSVFARFRRQVLLLPAAAVEIAPAGVLALLAGRAGLDPDRLPAIPYEVTPAPPPRRFRLIEAAILQTSGAAAETLSRLEACCTPLPGIEILPDAAALGKLVGEDEEEERRGRAALAETQLLETRIRATTEEFHRIDTLREDEAKRRARAEWQVGALTEKLAAAEADTAALRTSRSWRVTAPLRAVGHVARRLRPGA